LLFSSLSELGGPVCIGTARRYLTGRDGVREHTAGQVRSFQTMAVRETRQTTRLPAGSPLLGATVRISWLTITSGAKRLRLLLENEPDLEVVAEPGTWRARGATYAVTIRGCWCSIWICRGSDSSDPEHSRTVSGTQIVVLTAHREPALARQALDAGARGYVLKDAAKDELVEAVRVRLRVRAFSIAGSACCSPETPREVSGGALRAESACCG